MPTLDRITIYPSKASMASTSPNAACCRAAPLKTIFAGGWSISMAGWSTCSASTIQHYRREVPGSGRSIKIGSSIP
jgi:hypothetical protein